MTDTAADLKDRILLSHTENLKSQRRDQRENWSKNSESQGVSRPPDDNATESKARVLATNHKTVSLDPDRLHDGLSFYQYMIAGSIAGMVEHLAMFPVDTLKTRMQMMREAHGSGPTLVGRTLMTILKTEGVLGLYRGIGAMALGAGPAHAVYFSVYEVAKENLGGNRPGHHPIVHGAAGILATVASDAVFTPMDVVKQRLQLPGNAYQGVIDCIRRTLREEGIKAFYASYRTTVIMNAPYTATHFATYEAVKAGLKSRWPEKSNEENLFVHLTAGGAAGALASIVTTPLDVVKTRLQCQGVNGAERFTTSSIREVVRTIVEKEGPKALLRGMVPRVLFSTPAAAICWSTYEASKAFLQKSNIKVDKVALRRDGGRIILVVPEDMLTFSSNGCLPPAGALHIPTGLSGPSL
ncbi:hypothetical protein GOP47_0006370 [Adiantum capillus-veneris]|uniref:Uncharacterized protein n=1 Tax=Adiantum capillus-veneris TaxID=13818 RepID=A0A9D4ZKC0_ADICA|nr:hypothetical protein GOP47_0006370 [Adiantum capillus-veneris]